MGESYTDELLDASGWRLPARMGIAAKGRWQATIYRLRTERDEAREVAKVLAQCSSFDEADQPDVRAVHKTALAYPEAKELAKHEGEQP